MAQNKGAKQHHFVPECYTKAFVNPDGYLFLYDKWEGHSAFPSLPKDCLRSGYLYRQPVHAEKRFSNIIEDFYSQEVETSWPGLVEGFRCREEITIEDWSKLVVFISAQLTRVPLYLNAVTEILRQRISSVSDNIENSVDPLFSDAFNEQEGRRPENFSELVNHGYININIDPHLSLISLPYLIRSIPIFQDGSGFDRPKIIHNKTELPFLTSDSPVVFYTEKKNFSDIRPYDIELGSRFVFILPISSSMAIVNRSFIKKGATHCEISDRNVIHSINRSIARFAYRFVVSSDKAFSESYGRRYAEICPRPNYRRSTVVEKTVRKVAFEFGKPEKLKNAWTYDLISSDY